MIATPPPSIKKAPRKQLPDAPAGIPVGPLESLGPVEEYIGGDGPPNSLNDHPFRFTLTGKPTAMPRPRVGKHGVYSPFDWKSCKMLQRVKDHAAAANKCGSMSLPIKKEEWVSISVTYRIQRPNHHFGKTRDPWNIKPKYLNARPTGSDVDNYLKHTLDCLVKAGVLEDDCCVVHTNVWKIWAEPIVDNESLEDSTTCIVSRMNEPYKPNQRPDEETRHERWERRMEDLRDFREWQAWKKKQKEQREAIRVVAAKDKCYLEEIDDEIIELD